MRICVNAVDGPKINLPLPPVMIKSRLIWRIAARHAEEDVAQFYPMAREIYDVLAEYVRTHGHFVLVDVQDADGTHVKVIV